LVHILQYLPYQDTVKKYSFVSKLWRYFCTHRLLWLEYIRQKLGYEIKEYKSTKDYPWWELYKGLCQSSWKWRRALSCFNIYDEHFRALIVGDKKVGKTGLLFRLTRTKFEGEESLKRGISKFEMGYKTTRMRDMINGNTIKLQIYDTNMEDMAAYVKACNTHLSLSHVVIICFSVLKKSSFFNAVQKWLYLVKKRNTDSYVVILVGTNTDRPKRQVTYEEAAKVARDNRIYYTEVSNTDKNDFKIQSLIQVISNTAYRKVIEKKEPFTTSEMTKSIESDVTMEIVRKKQVLLIPSPEKIEMTDYGFDSDNEKEQKKDLDELRLQDFLSRMKQEEEEEEELKKTFLKSPRPKYVQEVETVANEDLDNDKKTHNENRHSQNKLEVPDLTTSDEIKEEKHEEDQDQDSEDYTDLTEWNEELDWETQEELAFVLLNSSIPQEEQMDDFENDFYVPKQEQEDERMLNEVLGNFKKQEKQEELIQFLTFDSPEKMPYDKQILQFAKKLRDDKDLNDKLTSDEKTQLKNGVRVCYDFITKKSTIKR